MANGDPVTVTTVVVDNSASAHQEGVLSDGFVSDAEMQETIDAVLAYEQLFLAAGRAA